MKPKQVFIFRHGQTDWNREGRWQGQTDLPLNETGRAQARGLIKMLREKNIEVLFSSDLIRAHETARIVAEELSLRIVLHQGLRETNLGEAEGLTHEEFVARFGEEVHQKWSSIDPADHDFALPGGETKNEQIRRVKAALEELIVETHCERIAVSTHGGAIRRLLHHFHPELTEPVMVANCALYHLEYFPETRIWRARL